MYYIQLQFTKVGPTQKAIESNRPADGIIPTSASIL